MRTRIPTEGKQGPTADSWTLPGGSFFQFLATHLGQIATEDVVGGIFNPTQGRGSIPPEHLVAILLLRYFENVSYEVAAQRAQYDVRWKAVLGRGPTEPSPPVSDTTLSDFEAALRRLGRHDVLLTRTIEMACEAGWVEGELETAQDSSPVVGRGAVKDTYNLLGDAIRKLIRGIAKAQGTKPLATAAFHGVEDLFRRSTKATASIDWAIPEARRRFLQQLVETAEALVAKVDPREPWGVSPPVVEAMAIVQKIIAQDIERDANGQVRMRQGVAEDRLISVHDPEMRRGHKTQSEAFEGFKFHHTVELTRGFILATEVTGANTHDSEPSAAMAERAEQASGCVVVKTIGDCAYGTESNRVAHAETGRELVAKLPRTPKGARLTKAAFTIDLDAKTVTCPQGITTATCEIVRANNAEPGREVLPPTQRARLFVFPPESCGACPQRGACISDKHPSRTLEVGPNEALFIQARAYQATDAYKADRRARQVVERQVARMVRLGARLARVFGIAKVRAQIAIIAAVVNLTRLAKLQATAVPA
jgi:hypothetical protein